MDTIQQAIKQAVAENRMQAQTPTDIAAAQHVWQAVLTCMKVDGMIFMDQPVTTNMLFKATERSSDLEETLAKIAQELNDSLDNFDYADSKDNAVKALRGIVEAARTAVTMVEAAHINWPLHKPAVETDEDRLWQANLLRGTVPGAPDAVESCGCVSCSSTRRL